MTTPTTAEISEKEQKKIRAAYALNLCTVSVSQIVQYNDVYIMEQEYNAILNNLNLEKMPKDEALLTILTEILNTITFFRIQDKKKQLIERQYQRTMKDAIWSAVPNIGVIMAHSGGGDPVSMAISIGISLAVQVGAGYMNYRKAKAAAMGEKDKEENELEIVAMEQFNALRRELFTTAWRLAKEYEFPDPYRLTENQIKQYNEILMDTDDIRRYERLEAIQDYFKAYPPFRYQIGHTAASIATASGRYDEETRAYYREKAMAHFAAYYKDYKEYGLELLREDQTVSSYALEYVDLLLANPFGNTEQDINWLLKEAEKKAGNACDFLQLCAIAYLRIQDLENAGRLLRYLVNENYNTQANAKLLSKVYSAQAFALMGKKEEDKEDKTIKARRELEVKYRLLNDRMGSMVALFPMPSAMLTDQESAKEEYLEAQRNSLSADYQNAFDDFREKYEQEIRRLLFPVSQCGEREDAFFASTEWGEKLRRETMESMLRHPRDYGFSIELLRSYLDILNKALSDLDCLKPFREGKTGGPVYPEMVRSRIVLNIREPLKTLQSKAEQGQFELDDYFFFCKECSFSAAAETMLQELKASILNSIGVMQSMDALNTAESELLTFCQTAGITPPYREAERGELPEPEKDRYLSLDVLLGKEAKKDNALDQRFKDFLEIFKRNAEGLILMGDKKISLWMADSDTSAFQRYFGNKALKTFLPLSKRTFAILRDENLGRADLLFTTEGLTEVSPPNRIRKGRYSELLFEHGKAAIRFPDNHSYTIPTKCVDADTVDKILKALRAWDN